MDQSCDCIERQVNDNKKNCEWSFVTGLKRAQKEWWFGAVISIVNILIIAITIYVGTITPFRKSKDQSYVKDCRKCETYSNCCLCCSKQKVNAEINANEEFFTMTYPRTQEKNPEILPNDDVSTHIYQEISRDNESFYSCTQSDSPYDQIMVVAEENGYINPNDIDKSVILHYNKETRV